MSIIYDEQKQRTLMVLIHRPLGSVYWAHATMYHNDHYTLMKSQVPVKKILQKVF